jgi:hypothetical protein
LLVRKKSVPTPAAELSQRLKKLELETAREVERRSRINESGETQGSEPATPTPPSF